MPSATYISREAPTQFTSQIYQYSETVTRAQFTDGGAAIGTVALNVTIPAGAVFLQAAIGPITAFAGDTSATIKIGDGTDDDRYGTGAPSTFTTVTSGKSAGPPSGIEWHSAAKTPVVTITSATDFTNVSAGQVTVHLFWIEPVLAA